MTSIGCSGGRARCVTALLLLGPFVVLPRLASGEPTVLRWSDLAALSTQQPTQLEAAQRVSAARAEELSAGAVPNPVLAAEAGLATPEERGAARGVEWGASVSLPLQWIYQRGLQVDAAQAGVDVAQQEARLARRTALVQLRSLYWLLAADQALLAVLGETERELAELSRLSGLRVSEGEARPIEGLRIEIELEQVRSELGQAQATARGHRDRLVQWLGLEVPGELTVDAALSASPPLPDQQALLRALAERHPQLDADRARLRELAARVDVEQGRRLPELAVKGFYTRDLDRLVVGAGVELGLPLWNLNTGPIRRAEAELAAGQQRLEGDRRALAAAVVDAWGELAGDQQAVRRYQQEILPRATQAAAQMERSFRIGESGLIDLIDARRVLLASRRDHLAAQLKLQLDATALQALSGDIEHDWN